MPRPSVHRALLAVWLLSAIVVTAPDARGQTSVSAEREEELKGTFSAAQEHYIAKRYTDALPLFQQVADELQSPNARLYVARCLREMGRDVEAYHAMEQTRREAVERAQTEQRFEPTARAAATELQELEKRIGRLTVSVPSAPDGTVVEVGGRVAARDTVVVVKPATVRVEVRAPGYDTVRREVVVAAGAQQTVVIHIVAPAPPPPAPNTPAPTTTVTTGGGVRIAGIVVLGLGALGWTALAVGGAVSNDKFADLEARCGQLPCTSDADRAVIRDGRAFELAANIGLGVGVAGTVAGTLLVIFGGPTEQVVPVTGGVLPGGGFMGYTASF